MAKRKKKTLFKRPLFSGGRNIEAENKRIGLLAQELGIAGMTVLVNDYGWTPEQANEWLGKMIDQANKNRVIWKAKLAIDMIEIANEGKD